MGSGIEEEALRHLGKKDAAGLLPSHNAIRTSPYSNSTPRGLTGVDLHTTRSNSRPTTATITPVSHHSPIWNSTILDVNELPGFAIQVSSAPFYSFPSPLRFEPFAVPMNGENRPLVTD